MGNSAWRSKGQWKAAFLLLCAGIPALMWYATRPITPPPVHENATVAKFIGDYETAKAIKDKSRGCTLAGVVVSAMISARDTAGAREWRETERYTCERGF